MIHPSYVDLMNVVNKDVEVGETPVINSRYSIVMATAKRARQIVDGDDPMIDNMDGRKPLSIAVEELEQGQLTILPEDPEEIMSREEADYAAARAMEGYLMEDALDEAESSVNGKTVSDEDADEEQQDS